MLTNQAARNPLANVVATPVVSEGVLSDVAVQVLRRNGVVDADQGHLEQTEEALCGVDVDAHAEPS
jgi:hypothetical protein